MTGPTQVDRAKVDRAEVDRAQADNRALTVGRVLFACHLLTVWGLALSNIFLGLTAIWCLFHRRSFDGSRLRAEGDRRFFLFFFYFGLLAFGISAALSYWPRLSLGEISGELNLVALPLALVLFPSAVEVYALLRGLVVMMVAVSLFALFQYVSPGYQGLDSRIVGPFSHYMTLSGVLLLGTCVVLGLLSVESERRRARLWLALGLLLAVLVLTLTRSVWISLALVLLIASQQLIGRRRVVLLTLGVTAVLLLLLVPQSLLAERFRSIFSLTYPSNYDRLAMAEAAWSMVEDQPLYGIGPGLIEDFYPIYRHPTAPSRQLVHLHNNLLQVAAERGLVCLAAFVGLMVSVFVAARSHLRSAVGRERAVFAASFLSVIAFNVAGLFEANWNDTEVQRVMLFLMAAAFATIRPQRVRVSSSRGQLGTPGP